MDNELNIFDSYLLGFFTDFIDFAENIKSEKTNLIKFCYLSSLLELNKFDKYHSEIEQITDETKSLFNFYFELFTFDLIPSYYNLRFNSIDNYYDSFERLSQDFDKYVNLDYINSDSACFHLIELGICYQFLSIFSVFFKYQKYSLTEYTRKRDVIFQCLKTIEHKYLFETPTNAQEKLIEKALVFYWIGSVYSYYDDYKHKEKIYYEKSISCKMNIFALTDLIDLENEDSVDYLKTAVQSWNFHKPIAQTEYYPYFIAKTYLKEIGNEAKKDCYYRAISIIEKMNYKTTIESYPYFNLALIKEELSNHKMSEHYLEKSIEILQNATGITLGESSSNNIIYFLDDFQDFLYEKCKTQISQNHKMKYNSTLDILYFICEKIEKLGYSYLKAKLKYDIILLKIYICSHKRKCNDIIEDLEKFLAQEEEYLLDKQKSEIRARLAYEYYSRSNLDKYNENIKKAVDLDANNKTVLKLIALTKSKNINFLDKNHICQIVKITIISFVIETILGVFFVKYYNIPPIPLLHDLLLFIGIPFLIITFYPLITSLKVGQIEIKFRDIDIPLKDQKIDIK
ncbi:MAG: hypothetical protein QW735_04030 [archaeon]